MVSKVRSQIECSITYIDEIVTTKEARHLVHLLGLRVYWQDMADRVKPPREHVMVSLDLAGIMGTR